MVLVKEIGVLEKERPTVGARVGPDDGGTRQGLTAAQVEASRRRHGENKMSVRAKKGLWRTLISNLNDPVIKVLLLALGLHLLLLFKNADLMETLGIAISVVLATLISGLSEYRSEAAFDRLCAQVPAVAVRVRREGRILEIPCTEVVVGDVLLLCAGERVQADGRLLCGRLTVDQSTLTGESCEVVKRPFLLGDSDTPDSKGALFSGCTVLGGEGEMEVTQVGDATFLGGISGELGEQARTTPLKARLTRLAGQISRIGYIAAGLCVLICLANGLLPHGELDTAVLLARLRDLRFMGALSLKALTLGLTVVVVAVPEGLPMMIAVVLSANVRRMQRDRVLVRRSAGIEAAGCMNILFTDKTGTLTGGRLSLASILTVDGEYKGVRALKREAPLLFEQACLCAHYNTAALRGERDGQAVALGGNATDRALLGAFLPFTPKAQRVTARIPFDSASKYTATALAGGIVLLSGAPERLLPHVRWALNAEGQRVPAEQSRFYARLSARAAQGERMLLLCRASAMPRNDAPFDAELICAVGFADPVRPESARAVRELRQAGVQVVMVTGDAPETARSVANGCGLLTKESVVLEREALAALSDGEVKALLPRLAVVARALPTDKSRLVRLAAECGLSVGMTGDGVNDAPALKAADVGFAMGSGTQVAKDAGDVVILDDNLASIARAVLYGRTIFKSIRKFITLQLVMNFCAVGISLIGPLIGFESPVTVVQMLWINLIMDTLGGLAFAGEAPMPIYMHEPPLGRNEPILSRTIVGRIAYLTAFTVALSVFFLKSPLVRAHFRQSEGEVCLLTAFFAFFIFAGIFHCFNARSDRVWFLDGLLKNRAFILIMTLVAGVQLLFVYLGGPLLRTVPLYPRELFYTLLLAFSVLPVGFFQLCWRRLSGKRRLY